MAPTEAPCDARVADGAIRGSLVGTLWAVYFGPSEVEALRECGRLRVAASCARYASLSVLSFGGFFGAYNGIQCGAERMFGPDSLACPIFAGGTVGAVIGAVALPPPHAVNAGMFGVGMAIVSGASAWAFGKRR